MRCLGRLTETDGYESSSGYIATTQSYDAMGRVATRSYDAAGNQLAVNGNTLAYDAENRPSSVTEPAGGGTVQYFYDGAGRRVEKLLNGNLTVFVYDALGQLAAEYDSGNTPTPVCQTCYLVQDVGQYAFGDGRYWAGGGAA